MQVVDLKPGQKVQIISLKKGIADAYRRRLLAMGLLPGAFFEVLRIAPLGDPMEIKVRGTFISLRKNEAALMHVKEIIE